MTDISVEYPENNDASSESTDVTIKLKSYTNPNSAPPSTGAITEAEPDAIDCTVRAGEVTPEENESIEGTEHVEEPDSDEHDILVETESSWYPPLPIPEGVDNDNFQGNDGNPLHRGRWIIFLSYDKENSGNHYTQKYCETLTNRGHFKINGDGDVGEASDVLISALSRAEIKQPFTTEFEVEIKHAAGQDPRHFFFALATPDPKDGVIQNSNLYGKIGFHLTAYDSYLGRSYCWQAENEDGNSWSNDYAWSPDTVYRIRIEQIAENGYLTSVVTIYDGETVVWTTTLTYGSNSRSRTFRSLFTAYTTEENQNYTEFFIDNFKVIRTASRKAKVIVSIKHGETFIMASDDVIDFSVSNREGSYPSANLSLKNKDHAYDSLSVIDEIEIRAGWEHKLFLLFRGNIDTPEQSFPPTTVNLSSCLGFARRLDFLESDSESWSVVASGAIVKEIISNYFGEVFTADWVAEGISTSLDSDDEPLGTPIKKLADLNGFVIYVDFNKCVHFIAPANEESQSNLVIKQAEDILSISNRDVDEILNAITVKGETHVGTAQDAESIAAYYRRERTFNEPNLTSQAAVDARAAELLAKYKDPAQEIPIRLAEVFILEMFDRLTVDCQEVNLKGEEIRVLSTNYAFANGGFRTSISGVHKNFSISELLADYSSKLAGVS